MNPLTRLTLQLALAEEGVREEGNNRGKKVLEYLRSVGLGGGNPWCAAFVYWAADQAADRLNEKNPLMRTGYCPYIATWAKDARILFQQPKPGDIFLRYGTTAGVFRACHTGYVVNAEGTRFGCIEGNTNLGGSREGIGVFKRVRTIRRANEYRFVRWDALVEEDEPEQAPTFQLILGTKPIVAMPVRGGRALCPVKPWAQALGLKLVWHQEDQSMTLNGKEVATDVCVIEGTGYAPIRDLVASAGLKVRVEGRSVIVTR